MTSLLNHHGYDLHVQQDALLQDTGLYNVYAVRASKDQSLPSEVRSKLAYESRFTWYSQNRLVTDVRHFLTEKLPDYMVPAAFVLLDTLPLTPNGKVDRRALPAPEGLRSEYVAPRNELERRIAEIWQQLLGVVPVSIYDNFFELGGHSLLVTRLVTRVRHISQVEIPVRRLFESPTIAEFAKVIEQVKHSGTVPQEPLIRQLSREEHRMQLSSLLRKAAVPQVKQAGWCDDDAEQNHS